MIPKKFQDQINAILLIQFSAVLITVCFGCTRQKPNAASPAKQQDTNTQPQQNGELVFKFLRSDVKESHGVIATVHFGLKPVTDLDKNEFRGIPQDFQNIEILKWKLSNHERGTVFGIRGTNAAGEKSYVLDTDNDRRFDDEKTQSLAETTPQIVRYIADDDSESQTSIEILPGQATDEYAFRDFWKTTLRVGQETLPVGMVYLGTGKFLMFGDTDQDGSFEKYINVDVELALGGNFWKVDVDFAKQSVRLNPGTGKSMTVGATAPEFQLDADVDANKPIMFVFCKCTCAGCASTMPKIEKIWRDQKQKGQLSIVNIATDENEMQANLNRYNITFPQTVQPELWGHFGVTPTPTIVVIDKNKLVRFRGHEVNEELEKLLTGFRDN